MKNIIIYFAADKENTIGNFLLEKGMGSSNIFNDIKHRLVLLNGNPVRDKNVPIFKDDKISVQLIPEDNDLPLNPNDIDPLYEDQYLLIVNKPAGLLVEPYKKNTNNNLASMVANYFFKSDIKSKVHLVNRLDRCTSGVVLIAKNRYIKNLLVKTEFCKKYLAVVEGKTQDSGTIKIMIDKEPNSNSRIEGKSGKESITKYKTISYNKKNDSSLVEVEILTGRTHQIRLSFSSIGHPLVGDKTYGSNRKDDIQLQAFYLRFRHPILGTDIEINIKKDTE